MSQISSNPRRIPTTNHHRNPTPPNLISSSPNQRSSHPRLKKPPKHIKILQRCNSEPILWKVGFVFQDDDQTTTTTNTHDSKPPHPHLVLFRPQTCTDIFAPGSGYVSPSNLETPPRYKKDAKVVVNVTVEGSPGPVRTMVKLGASVEETIKLVVDKYSAEGRSPQLGQDTMSSFELHHSHFSLQSIKKTDTIADAGTRSFYLKKNSSVDDRRSLVTFSSAPDIVPPKIGALLAVEVLSEETSEGNEVEGVKTVHPPRDARAKSQRAHPEEGERFSPPPPHFLAQNLDT